jgi:glycosyltransferase involved in cell wall biosynthesis
MHDNEVAKALIQEGVDCLLQPVYTPIRTDGSSIAGEQVFFGGIDVYLAQKFAWARKLPGPIRRLINSPSLIRLATRKTGSTDPKLLGQLTTSMLRGVNGNQSHEVQRLVSWLQHEIRPDAIVLSNLLIGGAIPALRKALPQTKIAVMLQGDDIFLDHLPPADRDEAISLCRSLVDSVDHFITHSQFYADKMGTLLQIPSPKRIQFPLTIDADVFAEDSIAALNSSTSSSSTSSSPIFRLGYLARIAPEKGLHNLVDAFLSLADCTLPVGLAIIIVRTFRN